MSGSNESAVGSQGSQHPTDLVVDITACLVLVLSLPELSPSRAHWSAEPCGFPNAAGGRVGREGQALTLCASPLLMHMLQCLLGLLLQTAFLDKIIKNLKMVTWSIKPSTEYSDCVPCVTAQVVFP